MRQKNKLKTKAYNLLFLKNFLKNKRAIIPAFFNFSIKDLKKKKSSLINKIYDLNKKKKIILRSSSIFEDGTNFTNAGKYDSLILKKNTSYKKIESNLDIFKDQFNDDKDNIIIQDFIDNVDFSGVVFTKDGNTDAPYYLINYDNSGKTNLVTSGQKNEQLNQFVIYKNCKNKNQFTKLINICKYLEKKTKNDRLDIEFAVKNKKLFIFQIRYLPKTKINHHQYPYDHKEILVNIKKKMAQLLSKNSTLQGKKNMFSNMADWNPAEMLGEKPNTLALSMYKDLISDEIWRIQRKNYGYSDVFPNVLIFSFGGMPFVDLRTDINSFLPNNLLKNTKEIIVNKYLYILSKNTFLHDKIEFELVETCYSLNSKKRLKLIFDKRILNEYLHSLRDLTINIFKKRLLENDITKINEFKNKIIELENNSKNYIQKIFFVNKITKQLGTLSFAGIARCAFISQRILIDLKENNLITNKEYDDFFNSIPNITDEIKNDYNKHIKHKISKAIFLKKYGHLRPQTYEINSLNYKEGFKLYFDKNISSQNNRKKRKNIFKRQNDINKVLKKNLDITFSEFLDFSKKSIYWREKSKYYFTIGVDKIFENLINLGKSIKIKRKDLSYIDIKSILNYFSKLENEKLIKSLRIEIKKNKDECLALNRVKLPDVILSTKDILSFHESKSKINFITNKQIKGTIINLDVHNKIRTKINNKIIIIENADPGYDFIFNYKIKGLITKYGGSNSHMAIRCLENNIPACIGVGKINYELILKKRNVYIDCNNKVLKTL